MKSLPILSTMLMLGSIGLLIFGIVTDKSMVAIAMPLLVVGIATGAQARKREGK